MSKGIRFTDEFKQDAVAQVVDRGYAVSEVVERLGISTKSLYTWKAQFAKTPSVRSEVAEQAAEIRRLKRSFSWVNGYLACHSNRASVPAAKFECWCLAKQSFPHLSCNAALCKMGSPDTLAA